METSKEYILFKLDEQNFGIEVNHVISIERLQTVTEVPGTENYIKGLISLRGELLPIIDLKERLLFTKREQSEDDNRILVIKMDDIQAGLIIDEATEVINIKPSEIDIAPNIIDNSKKHFIKGITKLLNDRLVILLNLEKILNSDGEYEPKEEVEQREMEPNGKGISS